MNSAVLVALEKKTRIRAYGAWFAAVVMACVWVFLDNASLQPLYFFAGLSLALIGANSWGMARMAATMSRMHHENNSSPED